MSYDIIKKGRHESELDSITGHLISLAGKKGLQAPINKVIYDFAKEKFAQEPYSLTDPQELWKKISEAI